MAACRAGRRPGRRRLARYPSCSTTSTRSSQSAQGSVGERPIAHDGRTTERARTRRQVGEMLTRFVTMRITVTNPMRGWPARATVRKASIDSIERPGPAAGTRCSGSRPSRCGNCWPAPAIAPIRSPVPSDRNGRPSTRMTRQPMSWLPWTSTRIPPRSRARPSGWAGRRCSQPGRTASSSNTTQVGQTSEARACSSLSFIEFMEVMCDQP
jgi:hypothetical protein